MSSTLKAAILRLLVASGPTRIRRATLSPRQRLALDIENAIVGVRAISPRVAVIAARPQPPDLDELERVLDGVRKLG